MHKVPLFWRIHQVHHLDTHLDISTTVRFHPLEFVVNLAVSLPLVALIGGPAWVYLIYEILDAGINVFSHSNIQLPKKLNTILSWFVVTPNVHQVHHSAFQPETDCNFGAVFTIWDRLLGTYRVKEWPFESNFRFGLEYWRERQFNTIWFLISAPFRKQGSMRK
jgi:sterol desaturase/sphingolipid hydroxylase (fatty acid hydroxylase superfamily)